MAKKIFNVVMYILLSFFLIFLSNAFYVLSFAAFQDNQIVVAILMFLLTAGTIGLFLMLIAHYYQKHDHRQVYISTISTPMRFHNFLRLFSLPVGGLVYLALIVLWMSNIDYTQDAVGISIDVILGFLMYAPSLVMSVLAFRNLTKMRWVGVKLLIALPIYNTLLSTAINIFASLAESDVPPLSDMLSLYISCYVLYVYYRNRRLLFSPIPGNIFCNQERGTDTQTAVHSDVDSSFAQTETSFFEQERQQEQPKEEKRVYSPLDPPEKRKKRYAPLWVTVCLAIVCIGLGSFCVSLVAQTNDLDAQIAALTKENNKIQLQYENVLKEKKELKLKYDDLDSKLGSTYYYKWKYMAISEKIGFIVNGSKYYHRDTCNTYRNADEYWAHNIEYCKYLGYSECPSCW